LLALNAAIEAHEAGRSGSSFSVLADESERSAKKPLMPPSKITRHRQITIQHSTQNRYTTMKVANDNLKSSRERQQKQKSICEILKATP